MRSASHRVRYGSYFSFDLNVIANLDSIFIIMLKSASKYRTSQHSISHKIEYSINNWIVSGIRVVILKEKSKKNILKKSSKKVQKKKFKKMFTKKFKKKSWEKVQKKSWEKVHKKVQKYYPFDLKMWYWNLIKKYNAKIFPSIFKHITRNMTFKFHYSGITHQPRIFWVAELSQI